MELCLILSLLRDKNFLIPTICIGAINAFKKGNELKLNNILVSREWNWCSEQCELMLKFMKKNHKILYFQTENHTQLNKC